MWGRYLYVRFVTSSPVLHRTEKEAHPDVLILPNSMGEEGTSGGIYHRAPFFGSSFALHRTDKRRFARAVFISVLLRRKQTRRGNLSSRPFFVFIFALHRADARGANARSRFLYTYVDNGNPSWVNIVFRPFWLHFRLTSYRQMGRFSRGFDFLLFSG